MEHSEDDPHLASQEDTDKVQEHLKLIGLAGAFFMKLGMFDVAEHLMEATLIALRKFEGFNPEDPFYKSLNELQGKIRAANKETKNIH